MRSFLASLIFCCSLSLKANPDDLILTLYFDKDLDLLSSAEKDRLFSFLDELNQDDHYKELFVYGHTDSDGHTAYNQELSRKRARNVFDILRSSLPYPGIFIDALGERFPAVSNDNEHNKA